MLLFESSSYSFLFQSSPLILLTSYCAVKSGSRCCCPYFSFPFHTHIDTHVSRAFKSNLISYSQDMRKEIVCSLFLLALLPSHLILEWTGFPFPYTSISLSPFSRESVSEKKEHLSTCVGVGRKDVSRLTGEQKEEPTFRIFVCRQIPCLWQWINLITWLYWGF